MTPPSRVHAWVAAARPRTLPVGLAPIAVGTALAAAEGRARWGLAAGAGTCALLLQVGTNLINDHFDWKRGADAPGRVGPPRACAEGWLPPQAVYRRGLICFALAMGLGAGLSLSTDPRLLWLGAASVVAGYCYTGGPFPLGYRGLGDLFVFTFFGLVAVAGTYWLQTGALNARAILAGIPVGALSTALLAVNNLRDLETDRRAGKRTLAVRWGSGFVRAQWWALAVLAFAVPGAFALTGAGTPWTLLPWCAAPLVLGPGFKVLRAHGAALNAALAETARLEVAFAALFSLAFVLGAP